MKLLSVLRRWQILPRSSVVAPVMLGAALVALIFGCSSVAIEEEPASQVQTAGPAQSQQAPAGERPVQPTAASKEQTLENQSFRVQDLKVEEERGQTTLRVKFSNPVAQYRHFPLTVPARIVVDVYGDAKRMAQVENFRADTHWISGLRLSSSEGYLRLVMEIPAAIIPPYLIEPGNGELKIVIGSVNPQHTARKELQLVQRGKRTDVRATEAKPATPEAAPSPASVPQGTAAADKKYTGQRISLDFKDADIKNVFRLLAEVSGLNIVVTGDVQRKVTVRLVDVPWDQALDLLIDTNGLGKEQVGNVVRISSAGQLKAEKDALAAAKKSEENLEPLQTVYLSVNYAKVKDLVDKIKPVLSPRGTIVPDERSNTLLVRDIKTGVDQANSIVSRLDIRTPQVLIESNLIETTPTFARALGLELSFDARIHNNPNRRVSLDSNAVAEAPFVAPPANPLGATFSVIQNRLGVFRNVNATLSAAETEGKIRIISRPSVVTLNNIQSTIQSLRIVRVALPTGSTNIASGTGAAAGSALATEKIPVGIILEVTPQVSRDGFVLLKISVKSSSITAVSAAGGVIGDELTREALSNVLIRDGETVVIGGIIRDSSEEAESGVPYLRDIPVLGWLFKRMTWRKDFQELMVFITPRIIAAGSENLPTAEQLWREQMKKTEGG